MITISGQIQGITSRADRSWKLTIGTQELTPFEIGTIGDMQNKICFIAINPDPFTDDQKEAIENTKVEFESLSKMTKSQTLRYKLVLLWEQNNNGFDKFVDYYNNVMDKLINHYNEKIL